MSIRVRALAGPVALVGLVAAGGVIDPSIAGAEVVQCGEWVHVGTSPVSMKQCAEISATHVRSYTYLYNSGRLDVAATTTDQHVWRNPGDGTGWDVDSLVDSCRDGIAVPARKTLKCTAEPWMISGSVTDLHTAGFVRVLGSTHIEHSPW